MKMFIHKEAVVGFALSRDEPMAVGEEVTLVFRGHRRRLRCVSTWHDVEEHEEVSKLEPVSPWARREKPDK